MKYQQEQNIIRVLQQTPLFAFVCVSAPSTEVQAFHLKITLYIQILVSAYILIQRFTVDGVLTDTVQLTHTEELTIKPHPIVAFNKISNQFHLHMTSPADLLMVHTLIHYVLNRFCRQKGSMTMKHVRKQNTDIKMNHC